MLPRGRTFYKSIKTRFAYTYTKFMSNTLDKQKKKLFIPGLLASRLAHLLFQNPWHKNMV
jgi:hypothetical protein